MRFSKVTLLPTILLTMSCVPPMPLQPYRESDPTAAASLAKEESRTLPLPPGVAFSRITEALLTMKCIVTTSDSANGTLSFQQKQEYKYQWNVYYSVKEGTIHLTEAGTGIQCRLFLRGKVINYPAYHQPVDSPLAAEEYKKFFNELLLAIKTN